MIAATFLTLCVVRALFRLFKWFLSPFFAGRREASLLKDSIKWTSFQSNHEDLLNNISLPPASLKGYDHPIYISIIIPAFNESLRLPSSLPATVQYLSTRARGSRIRRRSATSESDLSLRRSNSSFLDFNYEIIVVDDGSTDGTSSIVTELSKSLQHEGGDIRIIQLANNHGKGFATRIGVLAARGEYILMVDADGASLFSDLERLELALLPAVVEGATNHETTNKETESQQGGSPLAGSGSPLSSHQILDVSGRELKIGQIGRVLPHAEAASTGPEIAVGSRHHLLATDTVTKRSFYRNLLMHIFHLLVSSVVGNSIQDTQCGFKLFTRQSARRLFGSLHLDQWAFDVELLYLASKLGISVIEVPVNWLEIGGSKLQPASAGLQMARDLFYVKLMYATGLWQPRD